jgi:alanine racemase
MIDISSLDANVGDEIEIFGDNNSVEDVAEAMGTIP